MFDIDASKLLIIGVFALIFLGPKELPRVMRQVGSAIGKLRRMASDFQGQFMDAMRESELDDIRKEVAKIGDSAKVDIPNIELPKIDGPLLDPEVEIRKAIESGGAPGDPSARLGADAAPLDLTAPQPAAAQTALAEDEVTTFRTPPAEPVPVETAQTPARRRSARPSGA